jgi:hypothetical protein
MTKRSILILGVFTLILISFSLATAQRSAEMTQREATPIPADKLVPITPPAAAGEKDSCFLWYTAWSPTYYLSGWNVGDKLAIYFDPTECPSPEYPFQLTDVEFMLYDFAGVDSVDVRFSVEIVCPDICDGPGIEIWKSQVYTITTFYPDLVTIYFPDTVCLDKPFFFNLEYMSGETGSIPSLLFDPEGYPADTCYQWVWYDGYSPPWWEWYDFWASPPPGWIVLGISGYSGEEQTDCGEWYWKPDTTEAPSGMPDFDQNQDQWVAYCGPTAVANCLWWFNAVPAGMDPFDFIELLAGYFSTTSGGTYVDSIQAGLDRYFQDYDFALKETTYWMPNFYEMEDSLKVCQDIILFLGFWWWDPDLQQWFREGGHYVTMAGVNSEKKEIAISDPDRDQCVQYPWWPGRVRTPDHLLWGAYGPDYHNNTQYVSHDVYISLLDPEFPSPGSQVWDLADYCYEGYKYSNMNVPERFRAVTKAAPKQVLYWHTEVEAAVMICPTRECSSEDPNECDTLWVECGDMEVPPGGGLVTVDLTIANDENLLGMTVPLSYQGYPVCCDSMPNSENTIDKVFAGSIVKDWEIKVVNIDHQAKTVLLGAMKLVAPDVPPGKGHFATLTFFGDSCCTILLDTTFVPPSAFIQFSPAGIAFTPVCRIDTCHIDRDPWAGWYFKPPYPDYAPNGMPDIDQKQDNWFKYETGQWSFCGPVAVANCFKWFDSKYNVPPGAPGDGMDQFPLVRQYIDALGGMICPYDDHDPWNVDHPDTGWNPGIGPPPPTVPQPFVPGPQPPGMPPWGELVERLAYYFNTDGIQTGYCQFTGTKVTDMQQGIDAWLLGEMFDDSSTLADTLYERTWSRPTFTWVETLVEKSQDVILLLGFWFEDPPESGEWWRIGGHYVTVAGVNSEQGMIAFSDPFVDAAEMGYYGIVGDGYIIPHPHGSHDPTVHNDEGNVSHDVYSVDAPSPSPGGLWWLPGYAIHGDPDYLAYNFFDQNVPDEFIPVTAPWNTISPIFTEVEYAIEISPWEYPPDCGDMQPDGAVNILDIVYLINYKFLVPPGPPPYSLVKADVNHDGTINILDIVYLINYKFLVPPGPPPQCYDP